MKTIQKLVLAVALFALGSMNAQVSVNVNIGTPPAWGPAGYSEVEYYYLPDIETYYDIRTSEYIYLTNGRWVRTVTVPAPYRTYNFYNGYKVVMTDYHGKAPYTTYTTYKVKYPKGYKGKYQKTVGVPPGQAKKMTGEKHGGGHGKGKGHDKGKH
ncbi:MAG: hypothetical protein DI539_02010 [Flavobacterium psychrophilum]|nr:MAG: hypothetical protein DI539_02010 [Flavobacterium psychrophilum]